MPTTVTLKESTHRKLEKLKEKKGSKSFDRLLNELAEEKLEIPDPEEIFGSIKVKNREKIKENDDRIDRYE